MTITQQYDSSGKKHSFKVSLIEPHPRYTDCYNVFVEGRREPFIIHEDGLIRFDSNWRRFLKPHSGPEDGLNEFRMNA